VEKLNELVRAALKSESYLTLTRTTYGVPFPGTPEELAAFQASETKKWGEIVKVAGMQEP
jgi:tripartite-type tricarboxylate transporter receptor subunit TctC